MLFTLQIPLISNNIFDRTLLFIERSLDFLMPFLVPSRRIRFKVSLILNSAEILIFVVGWCWWCCLVLKVMLRLQTDFVESDAQFSQPII